MPAEQHELSVESRDLIVRAIGDGDRTREVMRELFTPGDGANDE